MRLRSFFYSIVIVLAITVNTHAEPASPSGRDQTITLKDGTILKGELTQVSGGVYTIKSESLGTSQINADQVASIANANVAMNNTPMPLTAMPSMQALPNSQAAVNNQISQMQQSLMTNPAFIADIQQLASDPEVLKLLTNPDVISAATNRDVNALQNNAAGQELINNPKIKALIERLKSGSAQPSN